MLWFPVFVARFLPGWVYNMALLVHGEEALLAVGFIFAIHFFNGHLRPEKFPMDLVTVTGRITEQEMKTERPAEYVRVTAGGATLPDAGAPSARSRVIGRIIGTTAVTVGLTLVALVIFALASHL